MSHIPITNTSPLLYLYLIGVIDWLPELFDQVWTPQAVRDELWEGQKRGYQVPRIEEYPWLQVIEPVRIPSEWLSLDLGKGELAALAVENPRQIVLLEPVQNLFRRRERKAKTTI